MVDAREVKVTVLKRSDPRETLEESPATWEEPTGRCEAFRDGQSFTSRGGAMPDGFPCTTAWVALFPYARTLSFGGEIPWFREKDRTVVACPDGMRSVIFLVKRDDE